MKSSHLMAMSLLCGAWLVLHPHAATAQQRIPSIYDTPEARTFFGSVDPLSAPSAWQRRIGRWADDVCTTSSSARKRVFHRKQGAPTFRKVHPDEKPGDRNLIGIRGVTPLYRLVVTDLVPSQNRKSNVFARASAPYEDRLFNRIAAARAHSLEPADVMRMALQVTGGDYRLASLAAHSVLKEATKLGRAAAQDVERQRKQLIRRSRRAPRSRSVREFRRRYRVALANARRELRQHNRIVRPLKSLRKDPGKIRDKMGPWYHLFVLYTVDSLAGPRAATMAAAGEHAFKKLKVFMEEGGHEPEKAYLDKFFIKRQVACTKAPKSRPAPKPRSELVEPAVAGQLRCPKTRYPLTPAHTRKNQYDYRPGAIVDRKWLAPQATQFAECKYGRSGRFIFWIAIEWSKTPQWCKTRWNDINAFGTSHLFYSKRKSAVVTIYRQFRGGNDYRAALYRQERDGAARFLLDQVEPLAAACKPTRAQRLKRR